MSTAFPYQKSVRTHATEHATNRVGKTIPKNHHILGNVLEISRFPSPISRFPSPKIRFSSAKIRFSSHEIWFTQIGFLNFFNGFPLSSTAFWLYSMAFCFLQWFSKFLQRLSNFPQRLSTFWEIRENLLWRVVYKRLLFEFQKILDEPVLRNPEKPRGKTAFQEFFGSPINCRTLQEDLNFEPCSSQETREEFLDGPVL